jgi:hypothetical protein
VITGPDFPNFLNVIKGAASFVALAFPNSHSGDRNSEDSAKSLAQVEATDLPWRSIKDYVASFTTGQEPDRTF